MAPECVVHHSTTRRRWRSICAFTHLFFVSIASTTNGRSKLNIPSTVTTKSSQSSAASTVSTQVAAAFQWWLFRHDNDRCWSTANSHSTSRTRSSTPASDGSSLPFIVRATKSATAISVRSAATHVAIISRGCGNAWCGRRRRFIIAADPVGRISATAEQFGPLRSFGATVAATEATAKFCGGRCCWDGSEWWGTRL